MVKKLFPSREDSRLEEQNMNLFGSLMLSDLPLSFAKDNSSSDLKSELMEMISIEHTIGMETTSRKEHVDNSRTDQPPRP